MPVEFYFGMKGKNKTDNDGKKIDKKVSILKHPLSFFIKVHLKVFYRNPKETKAFTLFFSGVFMMLLMRSSDGHQIRIFRIAKYFDALMNKNIVDKKISHSV